MDPLQKRVELGSPLVRYGTLEKLRKTVKEVLGFGSALITHWFAGILIIYRVSFHNPTTTKTTTIVMAEWKLFD
jgi:hypothetical protein